MASHPTEHTYTVLNKAVQTETGLKCVWERTTLFCVSLSLLQVFGIQTASGTSALRIGAELLVRHAKYTTFYTSAETWGELLHRYKKPTKAFLTPVQYQLVAIHFLLNLLKPTKKSVLYLQLLSETFLIILNVVYVFLLWSMYSYFCPCILIVRPCILIVVHVYLLLSTYS